MIRKTCASSWQQLASAGCSPQKRIHLLDLQWMRTWYLSSLVSYTEMIFLSFRYALLHFDIRFQFEAAWCLTNLASSHSQYVKVLIDKGALDVLMDLLRSPHIEVVEQVIWTLGNMAGDSA